MDYDQLERMMSEISRFKDHYMSFSTNKEYTNLLGETASGLLKDAAADTRNLSADNRKRKDHALEVFAAFCMYFCAEKIKHWRSVDPTLAQEVNYTVYERILRHIKKDLEETGESLYIRNLIKSSTHHAVLDLLDKENRYVPLIESDSTDDDELPTQEVIDYLVDNSAVSMKRSEQLEVLERVLEEAAEKQILSDKEIQNICHYYQFGDGYRKLSNDEIAKKFGVTPSAASQQRKKAIEKLKYFIEKESCWKEEFS